MDVPTSAAKTKPSPKEKKPSKGPALVIIVILIIFLIGYTIYMFEAYKGSFFPFTEYGPKIDSSSENFNNYFKEDPPGSIRPLGPVISITAAEKEMAKTNAQLAIGYLCQWYQTNGGGSANFVNIPGDTKDKNSQISEFLAMCTANDEVK